MKNSVFSKIRSFIKNRIFYNVDIEEKTYVKKQIMSVDHKSFRIMLAIVFFLQFGMITYKLISKQFNFNTKDYCYLIFYSALAISCAVSFAVSDYLFKNGKEGGYFVCVAIQINVLYIWAFGITVLDSLNGPDLATYAYTVLAITALVILEPWVFIANGLGYTIILNIALIMMQGKGKLVYYPSIVITSLSIMLLSIIIAIINFNRRVNSFKLQKEVTDLNTSLHSQTYVDSLTNIYNRRYLTEHIEDSLSIGLKPSGVIMFDIDDFKQINDQYGHQNGDNCLIMVGEEINKIIKEIPNSYAVRYGGEEFMIFIKNTTTSQLYDAAEKIRENIESHGVQFNDGSIINITISGGISIAMSGLNYSGLINKADENLYIAKDKGKNQICQ